MRVLFILLNIILPVITQANNVSRLTGSELHGCSKNVSTVEFVLRMYNNLVDQSVASLGNYNRQAERFLSALKNSCPSLSDRDKNKYESEVENLRREKALRYSKYLLREIVRVSQFGLDTTSINQLESIRTRFNFEFTEIDPAGVLRTAVIRGTQNQEERRTTCTEVDLRESHKPFQKTRHQGETAWCFAYSAADLITHYYQKNNPGSDHRFSAVGMTVDYYYNDIFSREYERRIVNRNISQNLSDAHYGHTRAIFTRSLPSRELCLEADVTGDRNILSHIRAIESIEDLRNSAYGDDDISEEESEGFAFEILDCENCAVALTEVFPNLDLENLANVLRTVEDQSIMTRLTNLECQRNSVNPGIPTREQIVISESFRDAQPQIDRQISAKNPIYLSYHSTVIEKGNQLRRHDFAGKSDGHVSLIIGRRFNKLLNKCEYLVRNSYGSSCSNYHPSLSCENGQFWLAEETLQTAFREALWIKE